MKQILVPGLVAGVILVIVSFVLSMTYTAVFPQIMTEYVNGMFRPWTDPLMMAFYAYPIVLGIALAWVWGKTKKLIKGTMIQRGVMFGLAYFVVVGIPGMFATYTTFDMSLLMVSTWAFSGLVNEIVAGIIFARMNP